MSRLPHPSQPLDAWTLRSLTRAERQQARAARKEYLESAKAEKRRSQRVCQICGRWIFAESGLIAHHGYRRPGTGWQTPSCEGARELPFEKSRDVLGAHLEAVGAMIDSKTRAWDMLQQEKRPALLTWSTYDFNRRPSKQEFSAEVTRATFDSVLEANPLAKHGRPGLTFDSVLATQVAIERAELERLCKYEREQKERFALWTQIEGVE